MNRRWFERWHRKKRRSVFTAHESKKGQWGRIRDVRVRAGIGYGVPLARARLYPLDLIARASIGRAVGRYEKQSPWGTRQYQRLDILPKTHGLVNRQ